MILSLVLFTSFFSPIVTLLHSFLNLGPKCATNSVQGDPSGYLETPCRSRSLNCKHPLAPQPRSRMTTHPFGQDSPGFLRAVPASWWRLKWASQMQCTVQRGMHPEGRQTGTAAAHLSDAPCHCLSLCLQQQHWLGRGGEVRGEKVVSQISQSSLWSP